MVCTNWVPVFPKGDKKDHFINIKNENLNTDIIEILQIKTHSSLYIYK